MISNVQDFSSWNDHSSSLKSAYMDRPLRCYGFLMDKGQGICLRANNLHAYIELNRKIERILPSVAPNMELCLLHATSEVHSKSQVRRKTGLVLIKYWHLTKIHQNMCMIPKR